MNPLDKKSHNKLYNICKCEDAVDMLKAFDLIWMCVAYYVQVSSRSTVYMIIISECNEE